MPIRRPTVLTMVGLGAMEIAGPDGVRMLPAQDYMQGAYTTGLREDELIAAVHVPEAGRRRAGATSLPQDRANFAEASCAAWFDAASKTARIAVGALDGAPGLLPRLAGEHRAARTGGPGPVLLADELAGVMPAGMNTTASCTGPR